MDSEEDIFADLPEFDINDCFHSTDINLLNDPSIMDAYLTHNADNWLARYSDSTIGAQDIQMPWRHYESPFPAPPPTKIIDDKFLEPPNKVSKKYPYKKRERTDKLREQARIRYRKNPEKFKERSKKRYHEQKNNKKNL